MIMKVGDIIQFVESYKSGKKKNSYGLIIDERQTLMGRREFKINWLGVNIADTWHQDPRNGPTSKKIPEYFVISPVYEKKA